MLTKSFVIGLTRRGNLTQGLYYEAKLELKSNSSKISPVNFKFIYASPT